MHRDVKSTNILRTMTERSDVVVKIGDFGLMRFENCMIINSNQYLLYCI